MQTVTKKLVKSFKVVAVSKNANSFGLHGHILVARDRTTYEAAKTGQFKHAEGDILEIPVSDYGVPSWAACGFEIPRRLPKAPIKVARLIWGAHGTGK